MQLVTSDNGPVPAVGAGRLDIAGGTQVGASNSHHSDLFFIADLDSWVRDPRDLPGDGGSAVCCAPGKLLVVADPVTARADGRERDLAPVRVIIARMVDALPGLVRCTDPEVVAGELEEAFAAGLEAGPGLAMSVAYLRWPMLHAIASDGERGFVLHGGRGIRLAGSGQARSLRLRAGHDVVLCSDGLTSCLSDDAIAQQARAAGSAVDLCRGLLRDARGADDATVVIARC